MSQDEVEQILPGWQAASQAVAQEMAEWRRAHPKATLTEIEAAVFEAMQKLQTRALEQVVHASTAADVAAQPLEERPMWLACNARLEPRGRRSGLFLGRRVGRNNGATAHPRSGRRLYRRTGDRT